MDILKFACDVISVSLPENKENFLYNQLISENIEDIVFHETFLKSGLGKKGPNITNLQPIQLKTYKLPSGLILGCRIHF